MPLYLNEDQALLRDTARDFIAGEAPVAHLRALRDADDPAGFSRPLWRQFAEMGFTGILAAEADGGLGLGHVEAGIVLEEVGRNLTPSPFLSTAVGAVTALNAGAAEARARWLPGILAGETVAALAVDEGAKHRPERIAATATAAGNGWRLDGAKSFVVHGPAADLMLVAARTEAGPSLFAVPADADGLSREAARLVDSSLAAEVRLDGVRVDGDAQLGPEALAALLAAVRVGAAAEQLGVASGAMGLTVDYLKERRQFGRPIGSFQALQHRAAHLYSELEIARAATLKAAQLLDEGDPQAAAMIHAAKAKTVAAGRLAVQEGVQMFGGVGMTDEYDIGLYMKRDRALAEFFGDDGYHADALARLNGY